MDRNVKENRIRTGVLLAAGIGFRLHPLTKTKPKCLVKVNEKSILERLISSLQMYGFERLIVVTGYKDFMIRDYLEQHKGRLSVSYVHNARYRETNNIYSLFLARNKIRDPFLLMESDIIFNPGLLEKMTFPDRIAIADPAPWMDGTAVVMKRDNHVKAFKSGIRDNPDPAVKKTVNFYTFSLQSWQRVKQQLKQEISKGRVNEYYEMVFKALVAKRQIRFQGVLFDAGAWYEIDTIDDLAEAERLFFRRPAAGHAQRPVDSYPRKQMNYE